MDQTDREIIQILNKDGRASFTEIADEINVSEGTVRNRIENLKEKSVIEGFTVKTSKQGSKAFVMIKVSTDSDIGNIVEKLPSEIEVNEVAGKYDIIVEFVRQDNEEINQVLDNMRKISGIEETKTYTVLKTRSI